MTEYLKQKKLLYEHLISFLEDESCSSEDFQTFIKIIDDQKITQNDKEFEILLRLISKISKNHHRSLNFNQKIKKIIEHYSNEIKQTFTNVEIVNFFKSNKLILIYLFDNKVIKFV